MKGREERMRDERRSEEDRWEVKEEKKLLGSSPPPPLPFISFLFLTFSSGLSLLGFNQLTSVLEDPAPGLVSLWFLLLVVVSRYDEYSRPQPHKLPFRVSGVLVAAIIGCIIHYSMAYAKVSFLPLFPSSIFPRWS